MQLRSCALLRGPAAGTNHAMRVVLPTCEQWRCSNTCTSSSGRFAVYSAWTCPTRVGLHPNTPCSWLCHIFLPSCQCHEYRLCLCISPVVGANATSANRCTTFHTCAWSACWWAPPHMLAKLLVHCLLPPPYLNGCGTLAHIANCHTTQANPIHGDTIAFWRSVAISDRASSVAHLSYDCVRR